jgi:hypothetical protein
MPTGGDDTQAGRVRLRDHHSCLVYGIWGRLELDTRIRVLDPWGQPVQEDGVSPVPGIYFAGLDFASTRKSGTILAIAEEAARLVRHVAGGRWRASTAHQ